MKLTLSITSYLTWCYQVSGFSDVKQSHELKKSIVYTYKMKKQEGLPMSEGID